MSLFAQLPYQKDKKWGISKNGTGDDKDSIIHRAQFDKIELLGKDLYIGQINDEWQFLTSNKLVNQQRYEEIRMPEFVMDKYAVGIRTGYIDVVDVQAQDFLVRSVKANALFDGSHLVGDLNVLMTETDGVYGLINNNTKQEILKVKYTSILSNNSNSEDHPLLAYDGNKNYVMNLDGQVIFDIPTSYKITKFKPYPDVPDAYQVEAETKKSNGIGFYDSKNKWLILPEYSAVKTLDNTTDAVVVYGAKGYGLYFQGKQLLDCAYLSIEKSDKRGYVAKVVSKKGEFYLTPEGKQQVFNE